MALVDPLLHGSTRIFLLVGHPTTSWGTTWPMERIGRTLPPVACYLCRPRKIDATLVSSLTYSGVPPASVVPQSCSRMSTWVFDRTLIDLGLRHGGMRAERREDIREFLAVVLPCHLGKFSCPAWQPDNQAELQRFAPFPASSVTV